jgi:hypothetical protein
LKPASLVSIKFHVRFDTHVACVLTTSTPPQSVFSLLAPFHRHADGVVFSNSGDCREHVIDM